MTTLKVLLLLRITSASEAFDLHYLKQGRDFVTYNVQRNIGEAKKKFWNYQKIMYHLQREMILKYWEEAGWERFTRYVILFGRIYVRLRCRDSQEVHM